MLLPREVVVVGGLGVVLLGSLGMLIFPRQLAQWSANNWWARLTTPRRAASQHRVLPVVTMRAMGGLGLFIALTTIVAVTTSS